MKPKEVHKLIVKLINYFQQEEHHDPTYIDFTLNLGTCPRTISRILREHEDLGTLRIDRDAGRRNRYIIQENK